MKVFLAVWMAFVSAGAFAAPIDLRALGGAAFVGKDAGATCHLVIGEVKQDFSGRVVQDYSFWAEGRSDLSFKVRLRGANLIREGKDVGAGSSEYVVSFDGIDLVLLAETANPLNVSAFRALDTTGVSGTPTTMIDCSGLKR